LIEKKTEELEAIKAAKAKAKAKLDKIKVAINGAKEDENLRIVLTYLVDLCGFRSNPVVLSPKNEVTNATEYNVGRLSVFHDLRKLMSAETENLILRREE